ncbi:hypothetical protein CAOG_009778 [Capsaspora owczarzaki ATCC 30864]|uniref:Uncharacterized protein n=1 Tax=Capsaspora owczarzaki (strain ATCC 30864) TaxID=595528 RepID=A0A0D2WRM5_CAPO3|nr:hypothetical protein CAOG_009778 [Capsaspora owczarzaki ATCC 30864]
MHISMTPPTARWQAGVEQEAPARTPSASTHGSGGALRRWRSRAWVSSFFFFYFCFFFFFTFYVFVFLKKKLVANQPSTRWNGQTTAVRRKGQWGRGGKEQRGPLRRKNSDQDDANFVMRSKKRVSEKGNKITNDQAVWCFTSPPPSPTAAVRQRGFGSSPSTNSAKQCKVQSQVATYHSGTALAEKSNSKKANKKKSETGSRSKTTQKTDKKQSKKSKARLKMHMRDLKHVPPKKKIQQRNGHIAAKVLIVALGTN